MHSRPGCRGLPTVPKNPPRLRGISQTVSRRFAVRITEIDGRQIWLGRFDTPLEVQFARGVAQGDHERVRQRLAQLARGSRKPEAPYEARAKEDEMHMCPGCGEVTIGAWNPDGYRELLCELCVTEDRFQEDRLRAKDYRCVICGINPVSPMDGQDTCPDCLRKQ